MRIEPGALHGELRQQELAESMRWHKSRLSHQVTRMAERGLVGRRAVGKTGALIVITAAGRKALGLARPVHARSVREHLLEKVTGPERTKARELLERLASGD